MLSQKENVYSVPLDAIRNDAQGQDVIYVRKKEGNFSPISVQVGMKNDYAAEISGAQLTDGIEVLADASSLPEGEGGDIQ